MEEQTMAGSPEEVLPASEAQLTTPLVTTTKVSNHVISGSFYPLQKHEAYVPPNYALSQESKQLIREMQQPAFASNPATVHMFYNQRLEVVEEEMKTERQSRIRAEKKQAEMRREVDDISNRLLEAQRNEKSLQEVLKRKEMELSKSRRDVEETNQQFEQHLAVLRKKHNDHTHELNEQIDQLNKSRARMEKERAGLKAEVTSLTQLLDHHTKQQAQLERQVKALGQQCDETQNRLDEVQRNATNLNNSRQKLLVMKAEVDEKLEKAEQLVNDLNKSKSALATQAEDSNRRADHEYRERVAAEGRQRAAEHSLNAIQATLEEEEVAKADLQRHLAKALEETDIWRQKYNDLIINVIPPLEEENKKLVLQLDEVRQICAAHETKISALEKNKAQLAQELSDSQLRGDRLREEVAMLEKKQKAFERIIAEWKAKTDDLTSELDASQKECRNYSTELFKTKAAYDESLGQNESLKRETKNLQDELKDVLDQLSEERRAFQALTAERKKLENERDDALAACEEAEATIECQDNKLLRAELEKEQLRQDHAKQLQEKDDEITEVGRNFQKALDQVQHALEDEARAKSDALYKKKKLESDLNKLEIELECAGKAISEAHATIHRYQDTIHDLQNSLEQEQVAHDEARKMHVAAERRCNETKCALEETTQLLGQSDRGRKAALADVEELRTQVNEAASSMATLSLQKRKLEGELVALQSDLDETVTNMRQQEEVAKKAMVDCARLADELAQEQSHSAHLEKMLKNSEHQARELQERLDQAEAMALAAGRKQIAALEAKCRDAAVELENEKRRHTDTLKNYRKNERRVKELIFQIDEDKKSHERLQDLVDRMQHKLHEYQRQIEEAEEIASLSTSKFRKCQQELEDAELRADVAENNLAKFRARHAQRNRTPEL